MNLSIKEVAALFGVECSNQAMISRVEFDSRLITTDSLFVPLAGTRDGHEFAQQAQENGAIAAFWSHPTIQPPEGLVIIEVADTLAAFQKLAKYYKEKLAPKIIAITGSNGKTTTKDMVDAVAAQQFKTYKTQGNHNNEIGLPLTILHAPADTEVLVLEMGMDHAGEIEALSRLAQPDMAAITLIGEAHIENLGSREGIAKAKMEITTGLDPAGFFMVPADEPLLTPYLAELPQQVVTFGLEIGDLKGTIQAETPEQTIFTVADQTYSIPVIGGYNVKNALIAIGIGRQLGIAEEKIKAGLAHFQLTKNRTQWLKAANGADILSDVYNANPTAMGLVLDSFRKLSLKGRRIAVLADMLELGPDSAKMHAGMAEHLDETFDLIFLYGSEMAALKEALSKTNLADRVRFFATNEKAALITQLQEELLPTDSVVLKGSNGMGLGEVVDLLTAM
jgi:UDP-N-acetylmuramoyl-tripeptide--D-alanyl-D-alanine ligase